MEPVSSSSNALRLIRGRKILRGLMANGLSIHSAKCTTSAKVGQHQYQHQRLHLLHRLRPLQQWSTRDSWCLQLMLHLHRRRRRQRPLRWRTQQRPRLQLHRRPGPQDLHCRHPRPIPVLPSQRRRRQRQGIVSGLQVSALVAEANEKGGKKTPWGRG